MSYFLQCEGRYIGKYTFDAEQFNAAMNSGVGVDEYLQTEMHGVPFIRGPRILGFSNQFYLLYEYNVNGYYFVRAERKGRVSRNRFFYASSYSGRTCTVNYDYYNPGESFVGNVANINNGTPSANLAQGNGAGGYGTAGGTISQESIAAGMQYRQARYVFGLVSMIMGIFSTALCWVPFVSFFSFAAGIAGIILSVLSGKKNEDTPGFRKAGLICSIIGLSLSVLVGLVIIIIILMYNGLLWIGKTY